MNNKHSFCGTPTNNINVSRGTIPSLNIRDCLNAVVCLVFYLMRDDLMKVTRISIDNIYISYIYHFGICIYIYIIFIYCFFRVGLFFILKLININAFKHLQSICIFCIIHTHTNRKGKTKNESNNK